MPHLRISVVLCTYNGAAFLPEQLDSLLAQTRRPDSIVISDDGSTDDTPQLLRQFEPRARAQGMAVDLRFNSENLGYVANFSQALARADGDVLFLCDQDDRWRADKIALMAASFERQADLALLSTNARLVDAAGVDLGMTLFASLGVGNSDLAAIHRGRGFAGVLLLRSMVTGATAAFRRQVIEQALPIGKGWVHDEWLAIHAAVSRRFDVLDDCLIDYRQHGGNQIGVATRRRRLGEVWRDLVRPRDALLRKEADRFAVLEDRLAVTGAVAPSDMLLLRAKLRHLRLRAELGRLPRWRRWSKVWGEFDGYRRFSTGWRSILRDLLRAA